jgi:hypothetical protein
MPVCATDGGFVSLKFRSTRAVSAFIVLASVAASQWGARLHAQAPGGFFEPATTATARPRQSTSAIQALLPPRGAFTFPAPYLTQGVRLTNASDCAGGNCVLPVGYSYWSNINNHVGSDVMLVFLGLERRSGGGGPTLFSYNKRNGETRNLGPLFSLDSPHSWASGEGWYFSTTQPTVLYMNDGPRMLRYDVEARTFQTVYDVTGKFGSDKYIWQMHSSADDRVHSFTLRRTGTWEMLGCVAYREQTGEAVLYAKKGSFDECQIDKSGRWLLIKEDAGSVDDNVVIDLHTGTQRTLTNPNGAVGHSDIGFGYMVGEDNFHPQPGAVRVWDFNLSLQGGQPVASPPEQGRLVYQLTQWESGLGHIAHGNSLPGVPINEQFVCSSNASRNNQPRVNEIVCYRLDGSLNTLVVAPNLVDLNAGGGVDDYNKMPKGNLDPTGEYFIWTANTGTNRLDAFIVRIPKNLLTSAVGSAPVPAPSPSPSPAPTPVPSPAPTPVPPPSGSGTAAAVRWATAANVSASDGSVRKTGGCGGCGDAGAVSAQSINQASGFLEFSATETGSLRYIGLGPNTMSASALQFAIRLQGTTAEVRERGAYKSETSFAAGDVFRISIESGQAKYSKNGAIFFSSTGAALPLFVGVALYDMNASISAIKIATGGAASTGGAPSTAPVVSKPGGSNAPTRAVPRDPRQPVGDPSRIGRNRRR